MDENMSVGLQDEIVAELAVELAKQPTFNMDVLRIKVANAMREVRLKRNYTASSYTDEQIEADLYNYYSVIKNLALYDFAQIGAPFESSHNENSTSRSWISRDEITKCIFPFVEIL